VRPLVLAAVAAAFALAAPTQTGDEIQKAINAAHEKYKNLEEGKNADYIPALAKVVEEQGLDAIPKTIGVEATGMRFNSIVAVERFAREVRHRTGLARPCSWSLERRGSTRPGVRRCRRGLLVDSTVL